MRKTRSRSPLPHLVILLGAGAFTSPILGAGGTEPIGAVRVEAPIPIPDNHGDTWVSAWAADGNVYSPSNDSKGFHERGSSNIAFNRLTGDDPAKIQGESINMMKGYGKWAEEGPDGCSWKSSGCYALDGVLYWVVARHRYGETSGDPHRRQLAANASIIKSTDLGKTWTRSARQNYEEPMFPGRRFATPYFVEYGQDGKASVDNADRYVYAISNDGFWDNGNNMILGRVARAKIADLHAADWEFYVGGDGMEDAAWTRDANNARLILDAPGKLGMTGSVYIPGLKRYFMIGWYYPAGGGVISKEATTKTAWDFYEAPKPWGPWTKIGSKEYEPQGYYSPQICPKFTSPDGRQVFAFTTGDWHDEKRFYRLTVVPLRLEAAQSRPAADDLRKPG
jgi:hypothetical protein